MRALKSTVQSQVRFTRHTLLCTRRKAGAWKAQTHTHTHTRLTRDSLALDDIGGQTTQRHNSWFHLVFKEQRRSQHPRLQLSCSTCQNIVRRRRGSQHPLVASSLPKKGQPGLEARTRHMHCWQRPAGVQQSSSTRDSKRLRPSRTLRQDGFTPPSSMTR